MAAESPRRPPHPHSRRKRLGRVVIAGIGLLLLLLLWQGYVLVFSDSAYASLVESLEEHTASQGREGRGEAEAEAEESWQRERRPDAEEERRSAAAQLEEFERQHREGDLQHADGVLIDGKWLPVKPPRPGAPQSEQEREEELQRSWDITLRMAQRNRMLHELKEWQRATPEIESFLGLLEVLLIEKEEVEEEEEEEEEVEEEERAEKHKRKEKLIKISYDYDVLRKEAMALDVGENRARALEGHLEGVGLGREPLMPPRKGQAPFMCLLVPLLGDASAEGRAAQWLERAAAALQRHPGGHHVFFLRQQDTGKGLRPGALVDAFVHRLLTRADEVPVACDFLVVQDANVAPSPTASFEWPALPILHYQRGVPSEGPRLAGSLSIALPHLLECNGYPSRLPLLDDLGLLLRLIFMGIDHYRPAPSHDDDPSFSNHELLYPYPEPELLRLGHAYLKLRHTLSQLLSGADDLSHQGISDIYYHASNPQDLLPFVSELTIHVG